MVVKRVVESLELVERAPQSQQIIPLPTTTPVTQPAFIKIDHEEGTRIVTQDIVGIEVSMVHPRIMKAAHQATNRVPYRLIERTLLQQLRDGLAVRQPLHHHITAVADTFSLHPTLRPRPRLSQPEITVPEQGCEQSATPVMLDDQLLTLVSKKYRFASISSGGDAGYEATLPQHAGIEAEILDSSDDFGIIDNGLAALEARRSFHAGCTAPGSGLSNPAA